MAEPKSAAGYGRRQGEWRAGCHLQHGDADVAALVESEAPDQLEDTPPLRRSEQLNHRRPLPAPLQYRLGLGGRGPAEEVVPAAPPRH
eukprot:scaffold6123_cov113-Isochrysis_galbana.AAC.15